jgi:hypothetical protein
MAEIYNIEELRAELKQLLQKQSETLNARVFGGVSDTELVEYDLRQEVIGEIQSDSLALPPHRFCGSQRLSITPDSQLVGSRYEKQPRVHTQGRVVSVRGAITLSISALASGNCPRTSGEEPYTMGEVSTRLQV